MGTGDPRVLSPQSRTRDNADPAGLSPPLVPLRVLTSSRTDSSSPSLRNNSLSAPSRTTAAMVDSWTTPSSTSSKTDLSSSLSTHTPLDLDRLVHAHMPRLPLLEPSHHSTTFSRSS